MCSVALTRRLEMPSSRTSSAPPDCSDPEPASSFLPTVSLPWMPVVADRPVRRVPSADHVLLLNEKGQIRAGPPTLAGRAVPRHPHPSEASRQIEIVEASTKIHIDSRR